MILSNHRPAYGGILSYPDHGVRLQYSYYRGVCITRDHQRGTVPAEWCVLRSWMRNV